MIYVSDLDGTLLNSEGNLTEFTINEINKLIKRGVKFTIASARSIYTANKFIRELDFAIPIILRNGVFVYEPASNDVLMKKLLNWSQMNPVMDFFIREGLNPIVHHSHEGKLFVDYTRIENYGESHYIESRLNAGDRRFRKVTDYEYDGANEFISMCVIGENINQDTIYNKAKEAFPDGYIIHKYIDTYSNHTWIEINHPKATKESAVSFVMDYLGESEYTAFGDNINDLGMLNSASQAFMPVDSYLDKSGFSFSKTQSIDSDGVVKKLIELNK